MIKVKTKKALRLSQGDILRDIEYIEHVHEENGIITISKIVFPLVMVLTQDCDLSQDYKFRSNQPNITTQDKYIMSVLVAPLYNAEHVYSGDHLSELDMKMESIKRNRTPGTNLRNNETPRYHYIEFPESTRIPPCVIDFKHYFSVNTADMLKIKKKHFVCRVSELYRENISQRYSNYLARIGLP